MGISRRMAIYSQGGGQALEGQKWQYTDRFATTYSRNSRVAFYYYNNKMYCFFSSSAYTTSTETHHISLQLAIANIYGDKGNYKLGFTNTLNMINVSSSSYDQSYTSFFVGRIGSLLHVYMNGFLTINPELKAVHLHCSYNVDTGAVVRYPDIPYDSNISSLPFNRDWGSSDGSSVAFFGVQEDEVDPNIVRFLVSTNGTNFTTKTFQLPKLIDKYYNYAFNFILVYDKYNKRYIYTNPQHVVISYDRFNTIKVIEYSAWGANKANLGQALIYGAQSITPTSNGTVLSCRKGFVVLDSKDNITRYYTNITGDSGGDGWGSIASDRILASRLYYFPEGYRGNLLYTGKLSQSPPGKVVNPSTYPIEIGWPDNGQEWNEKDKYFITFDVYDDTGVTCAVSPRNPDEWNNKWLG